MNETRGRDLYFARRELGFARRRRLPMSEVAAEMGIAQETLLDIEREKAGGPEDFERYMAALGRIRDRDVG